MVTSLKDIPNEQLNLINDKSHFVEEAAKNKKKEKKMKITPKMVIFYKKILELFNFLEKLRFCEQIAKNWLKKFLL